MIPTALDEGTVLSLAPEALPNLRSTRYGGDGVSVGLADLGAESADTVREMYAALARLLRTLRLALGMPTDDGVVPARRDADTMQVEASGAARLAALRVELARVAASPAWRESVARVRRLRQGPDDGTTRGRHAREAIHDIRGGALSALVLTLELIGERSDDGEDLTDVMRSFYLTRDQLKIMRNAVEDVDPIGRERDEARQDHDVRLLVEKWSDAEHRPDEGSSASVAVSCTYLGTVSRRCVEFSALDRVLYNLINNAARFASQGVVELYIRRIGENVRFAVANAISGEHRARLTDAFGESLGTLYSGGFTVGGEGVGLAICGEFVANAYGLDTPTDAVTRSYVGATIVGEQFVAWFHWPVA